MINTNITSSNSTPENNLAVLPGLSYPLGAHFTEQSTNFAIYVPNISKISLCLFKEETGELLREIELNTDQNKTGDIWHIAIKNLAPFTVYGYRILHKYDGLQESNGSGNLIFDPYAKALSARAVWADNVDYQPLGKVIPPTNFDWQNDRPPQIPRQELIIYEMHVRGFTQDASSKVSHQGTYAGLIEKIPYLKELGVNAIELMPIYEFNEKEVSFNNPITGKPLYNYFGYSPVSFFSPMLRYAYQTAHDEAINEFKTLVRECHKEGIEVILDVVYNHTSEGGKNGPATSFRPISESAYYMIDANNQYLNFSGCGNTFNCNHPVASELIIASLRYWVAEMHVDGFRFDLASIFTRSTDGSVLHRAPIVEAISLDPVLVNVKLIAEAWDAAGLYQVGSFYRGARWSEWNGQYRDVVRRFMKGDSNQRTAFATALCGSQDIYGGADKRPICSVNFVTAHDGFTLADLVSYNEKHNTNNGENNLDGTNNNESWNCGVEGPTDNKKIVALRERQMRNLHLALLISQGVPMLLMGDEYAHSRAGNNNSWNQDNQLNWFLWNNLYTHPGFYRFYRAIIQFRKQNPLFMRSNFLTTKDITWHGIHPSQAQWEDDNKLVAFTLNGEDGEPHLYIAFNANHNFQNIQLPRLKDEHRWHWVVNTYNLPPDDFYDQGQRPIQSLYTIRIHSYSAIVLMVQ